MDLDSENSPDSCRTVAVRLQLLQVCDLALDVAGLTAAANPALAAEAGALASLAAEAEGSYATARTAERGAALAGILAILAKVFQYQHAVSLGPRLSLTEEDPLYHFLMLEPGLRSLIKSVADEIAEYARALVQTEEGVTRHIEREFAALERQSVQVAKDREIARALHDRDAAYAVSRGFAVPPLAVAQGLPAAKPEVVGEPGGVAVDEGEPDDTSELGEDTGEGEPGDSAGGPDDDAGELDDDAGELDGASAADHAGELGSDGGPGGAEPLRLYIDEHGRLAPRPAISLSGEVDERAAGLDDLGVTGVFSDGYPWPACPRQ